MTQRKDDPNRPTCALCNKPMRIYGRREYICGRCGSIMPRKAPPEVREKQRTYQQERRHKVTGDKTGAAVYWRCINANDNDPFRPGYEYQASMIRADLKAGWLHKGTRFLTNDGEEVRV